MESQDVNKGFAGNDIWAEVWKGEKSFQGMLLKKQVIIDEASKDLWRFWT